MKNIKSCINESSLLNSGLTGLGFNDYKSILEKIDNSIDADANNILIHIREKKIRIMNNNKLIELKSPFLIIRDNGVGMDETNGNMKKLINLFDTNLRKNKNSKFGIGAIASDFNINNSIKKNAYTVYLTTTKNNDNLYELIIDHDIIKENGWTNNVQWNKINKKNLKIWN